MLKCFTKITNNKKNSFMWSTIAPSFIGHYVKYVFFSVWVLFHERSRFTGQQVKGEGIYLTPLYYFLPLHRHLNISRSSVKYWFVFLSIWVFFHEHSRFTEQQEKGEDIYLTPLYYFHPLHSHLDINRSITVETSPLHIASSRTQTGNLHLISWCRSK